MNKENENNEYELRVRDDEEGMRLDVFICRKILRMSRAEARHIIKKGWVTVGGEIEKKGIKLKEGNIVRVERMSLKEDLGVEESKEIELRVLYEDEFLVAIDKPAGMHCHPLERGERETIANTLVAEYPEMKTVGYRQNEPGIIHRLDNQTSGVLVCARKEKVFRKLIESLKRGKIEKRYLALCKGIIDKKEENREIRTKIAVDKRRKVKVEKYEGRKGTIAVTKIEKIKRIGQFTLVEVKVNKAVRHQIRVHLSYIGHPIVGDKMYKGPEWEGLERHFLHASMVRMVHPMTKKRMEICSEIPAELRMVIEKIEEKIS